MPHVNHRRVYRHRSHCPGTRRSQPWYSAPPPVRPTSRGCERRAREVTALFAVVQEKTRAVLTYADTFSSSERGRAMRAWHLASRRLQVAMGRAGWTPRPTADFSGYAYPVRVLDDE